VKELIQLILQSPLFAMLVTTAPLRLTLFKTNVSTAQLDIMVHLLVWDLQMSALFVPLVSIAMD